MGDSFLQFFDLIYFFDLIPEGDELEPSLEYLRVPGFYGIHCLTTNKTWLSHATDLFERLNIDYNELYHNKFEGSDNLVSDAAEYGLDSLVFVIIKTGEKWENLEKRKEELAKMKQLWPYPGYNF